jgi:hypothetical protein
METPFKMKGSAFYGKSPMKTRLGRWLLGRKKHTDSAGNVNIVDKKGRVVKTKKADGTKIKYKKGNRPDFIQVNPDAWTRAK